MCNHDEDEDARGNDPLIRELHLDKIADTAVCNVLATSSKCMSCVLFQTLWVLGTKYKPDILYVQRARLINPDLDRRKAGVFEVETCRL